ncbi:HRDC domain-containing protein [Alkalitalea saponilacus]|uniref:UvrD-like helicase C-terminal domain-containing protein n=1 Tax=Alkalitalea saponilacus TaxID=889453 RepID=A0A1T5HR56_9BACT|nr:HRDC domain-containing protein [Alkalitalea saponilacus]SKC23020.1 UvrD-like helicase C-terminal domain-containing protein [Alkalitalea saponilacus]
MTSTIITSTPTIELARQFIENTGKNLFLTGKAGTGKTTFLRQLKTNSPKRMAVVAPTGVAAINAGGVTIHSLFQLPFGPQIPNHYLPQNQQTPESKFRFSREKLNILRSIDLLVIDEISMVRADLLDAIDGVFRRFRNRSKPFGGVQILMIGDLQQLAPVVRREDWALLEQHYSGPFFFQSKVLQHHPVETIELTHIFRQNDETFINVLNEIRENKLTTEGLSILQKRYIPDFKVPKGYITLTSHNKQADDINRKNLDAIKGSPLVFKARVEGEFPETSYPNDFELKLKPGAQVMFTKNDTSREKLYFNGKIGTIDRIIKETVYVRCSDPDMILEVEPVEWQNYKYTLNQTTNEIEEEVVGKFIQYPLRLAWAITIHKSQGLTFDHAVIDANAAFAHGQTYVALSRCRTLEGLVLSSPIDQRAIISSSSVNHFIHKSTSNPPTSERIKSFQLEYERELIFELFDFSQLNRRLSRLHKEISQNHSVIFGNFPDAVNELLLQFREKIQSISEKFNQQLNQLLALQVSASENQQLQERIKKAADYFLPEFEKLFIPVLEDPDFETDNKEIRKTINDQIDNIQKSYTTHHHCLDACREGFTIASYLAAKSVSNIEKKLKKPKQPSKTSSSSASERPELYNLVRAWRDQQAEELNLPHYMVLQTKTMVDLANKLPSSIKELHQIKGVGKRKADQFGKQILELIQSYRKENDLGEAELDFSPIPGKKKKKPTWKTSLEMFKAGAKPTEIARKQGLVVSTIYSHLAKAIGMNELDPELVLSKDKIDVISQWIEKHKTYSVTSVFTGLNRKYTMDEIKIAMATARAGY